MLAKFLRSNLLLPRRSFAVALELDQDGSSAATEQPIRAAAHADKG
jgi:hypothetical protein